MWPFSHISSADKSVNRAAAFERQLDLYAFLIADRYLLFMDEAAQDQLIKLLYTLGKPPTPKPTNP